MERIRWNDQMRDFQTINKVHVQLETDEGEGIGRSDENFFKQLTKCTYKLTYILETEKEGTG